MAGLFSTHTEVDQLLAITSLQQVAEMSAIPGLVKGFRVQVEDQFNARQMGYSIIEQLPYGFGFRDWFQTHGNLYQAIQLSRNMVGLLIFMIIAIAAFNVISMLMMSVIDKRRDIAILQTLGMTRGDILRLFLTQGAFIGLFGVAIGVGLGVLGSLWVAELVAWIESLMEISFPQYRGLSHRLCPCGSALVRCAAGGGYSGDSQFAGNNLSCTARQSRGAGPGAPLPVVEVL